MRERERGSGTLLALGVGAVLIVGGLAGTALATIIAATHRVDAAADLAALSAARLLVEGEDKACAKARAIATANGVELDTCQTANLTVEIVVRVRTPRLLGTSLTVRARARAGPSTIEQQRERATHRADRTRTRAMTSGFRHQETGCGMQTELPRESGSPRRGGERGLPWPRPASGSDRHQRRGGCR